MIKTHCKLYDATTVVGLCLICKIKGKTHAMAGGYLSWWDYVDSRHHSHWLNNGMCCMICDTAMMCDSSDR